MSDVTGRNDDVRPGQFQRESLRGNQHVTVQFPGVGGGRTPAAGLGLQRSGQFERLVGERQVAPPAEAVQSGEALGVPASNQLASNFVVGYGWYHEFVSYVEMLIRPTPDLLRTGRRPGVSQ